MSTTEGPGLGRSTRRLCGAVERQFPNLDDFVARLVATGDIASEDDLFGRRHDLLAGIFHAWTQLGQTGCQFASHLAKNRSAAGWYEAVLVDHTDPDMGGVLDAVIGGAGSADNVEAVLVLLPSIRRVEQLADLIGTLCRHPSWAWEVIGGESVGSDGHVCVGLRWAVPATPYQSWVLAFGNLEAQPFTRRAPVTALTIRTRQPPNPYGGLDLAKMDSLVDDAAGERFMNLTRENKLLLLGGEFADGARARVTARIPVAYAARLGPPDRLSA